METRMTVLQGREEDCFRATQQHHHHHHKHQGHPCHLRYQDHSTWEMWTFPGWVAPDRFTVPLMLAMVEDVTENYNMGMMAEVQENNSSMGIAKA